MTELVEGSATSALSVAPEPELRMQVVTTTDFETPFQSRNSYEFFIGMAKTLSSSGMVPKEYQGEKGVGSMLIAMELANRSGAPLLAVLQSLHVIHGKPGWSAAWIIQQINTSRRYATDLRFEFEGEPVLHPDWGTQIAPGDVCWAWARRHDGSIAKGAQISLAMAKAEKWVERTGSKWRTMPEQMLMYRAATFFARVHCPDVLFGVPTTDELVDRDEPQERTADKLNEQLGAINGEVTQADG